MIETFRDITIAYHNMTLDCQVRTTEIVSHYFAKQFKESHGKFFIDRAKQQNITCPSLEKLENYENYDVRLNSTKPQSSIRQAHSQFGSYNRTKRLKFYVILEDRKKDIIKEEDGIIQFKLINGAYQKGQAIKIGNLDYQQVEKLVKNSFAIEGGQQIQFVNLSSNTIIPVQKHQEPYKVFRQKNLTKIGIKRIYSAG